MRKLFALAALAALALPAVAGDCLGGYACNNACPLAKQANSLRAYGSEALATSLVVRAETWAAVERNLARI